MEISAHYGRTMGVGELLAAAEHAELVEFDVRRCGDGVLVCHHDPRVGGRRGPAVGALTYAELCAVAGTDVPTCEEVMAGLAGRARGHIDLKESGYEDRLVQMAISLMSEDGFVVTTTADESIARITRGFPGVPTALSLGRQVHDAWPLRRVAACGASGVALHRRLAPALLGRAARAGLTTMVWTVNGDAQIERCLRDPRIDVLITDRPDFAAKRRIAVGQI
ncbi:glycerophosphoryl diester phosphodiesterase [Allocatelliglobosispora scoriae]|uniref:Glycerophosphoryl diester phosphodiesterase n=1 Tax=Allocatelliglobosispora scoriae TaxID=643052 RepID=A0A841BLX8_9ACTN|nr:glycerophosphodiester phosphodiesterase family protein [Allocatelliglobosispora scoriae]MBB5868655.1 glycerophosphoryl diester phosphodiesterase [Allocatelliglobosispora scoriae]